MAPTRRNSRGLRRALTRIAVGPAPHGWRRLRHATRQRGLHARRPDQGRRPDAPLFHLGHDRALEARRAHARELSDRASLDDVRARDQARRHASQHFLARLGEARLVELVRALERRRDHRRARLALRAARGARRAGRASGHGVLRAADRVADADPARLETMEGRFARGQCGGRAGQSGDHRAGATRLGPAACAIPTGRPRPR